jgi:hypothetical protein
MTDAETLVLKQPVFEEWPKITRLRRTIVVTEKIDGTNAQIHILEDGTVLAGSRNRYVTVDNDNAGFAKWVKANEQQLVELGPGRHYGEWWGAGIQRRYDLKEKRFSLFNTRRWDLAKNPPPACCLLVPQLYIGEDHNQIESCLDTLRQNGSVAAPGFMRPEGIVVYHTAAQSMFKVLLENDDKPKGAGG